MKILIVDDDPEMGELIEQGLRAEGYETVLVRDGVEALLAIERHTFAAAAIDVMLPGMSGFEICRRIRATTATLPILLLTARAAIEDRVFGLDAGADDYLTKPFAFVELNARLRALLRREATAEKLVVTVGSIRLDTLALSVSIGGTPIGMSPKEFALLRLLASRAGQLVSREHILEQVWGSAEHIDQNVVDQYISYLRRKIDTRDTGVKITTTRGTGYTLQVAQ